MAANMTGMQVEGTTADRGHRRPHRSGAYGVAAAGLVVLTLAGLLLWVVNGKGTSNVTTAPASVGIAGTSRGQAEQDAIRFVEENTITLPSVGMAAAVPPVILREQQRFLEENTILPGAGSTPYMEAVTPLPGQDR